MNSTDFVFRSLRRQPGLRFGVPGMACLLALLSGCGGPPPAPPSRPPPAVSVATAITRDVPQFVDALGQTSAFQTVNIVSQVDGQIVEMPFQQGSLVKKGDKLAVIFQPPYIAALKKAEGQVATDQANLAVAQSTLDRNEKLLPDKLISEQQYETYKAAVEALKGQLEVDQAQLDTAQINLDYTTITAPVDGMVGNYKINVGNVVKANDLPITTIQTMNPMYADFVVSESEFPNLRKHFDENGGKLTVHVVGLSDTTREQDGELSILGNAVAPITGTISLRATIPNPNQMFWPNQPIRARIFLDTLKDAVLVPQSAVQLSQQGEYVFVVHQAKAAGQPPTVEKRLVTSGQIMDDGSIVITTGLQTGEQVVTEGQMLLAPDSPVMIANLDGKSMLPPPPGAPAPAATPPADTSGNTTAPSPAGAPPAAASK